MRFYRNSVKQFSWGDNYKFMRDVFYTLSSGGGNHSWVVNERICYYSVGDVIRIELVKRGKTKPRKPVEILVLKIIDELDVDRWSKAVKVEKLVDAEVSLAALKRNVGAIETNFASEILGFVKVKISSALFLVSPWYSQIVGEWIWARRKYPGSVFLQTFSNEGLELGNIHISDLEI
jgi:hypothetical protein